MEAKELGNYIINKSGCMDVRDLRIGNLVFDYGIITEANGFLLTRLEEINNEGKLVVNISPIPLTEEWLIKSNFSEN